MHPDHAPIFRPSAAEGWMTCPGRPALEQGLADEPGSYAIAGSLRHRVCELVLRRRLRGETASARDHVGLASDADASIVYLADWVDQDDDYAHLVTSLAEVADRCEIEHRVEVTLPNNQRVFGTADAVLVIGNEIIVIDRKTGHSTVRARDNKQLLLYALGAYSALGRDADVRQVRLIVHQHAVDEWVLPIADLLAFGAEVSAAVDKVSCAIRIHAQAPLDASSEYLVPTEAACKYCKALASCPKVRKQMEDVFEGADLPHPMRIVPIARAWCDAVEAKTLAALLAGEPVPGYKLVLGRAGNRRWAKPAEDVVNAAQSVGVAAEHLYKAAPLISPAEAERLLKAKTITKGQWAVLDRMIVRAPPQPTIAPVSDARDAHIPGSDFDSLKD